MIEQPLGARFQCGEELRIGLVLPTREYVEASGGDVGRLLQVACEAERAGADSLWVGDSLFARPRFDPLSLLAALAVRTNSVTLGTAVLVAPMWNPLLFARAVATIDQLSEGRVVLGSGPVPPHGAARKEFAALGIPFEGRLNRLAEVAAICRSVWSMSGPVDFDGSRWSFRNVDMKPKPVQPGGPPIWLGVKGRRGLALVGASAGGWIPIPVSTADYAAGWEAVRRSTSGALPTAAVYLTVAVDEDSERAEDQFRRAAESYYRAPWATVADIQDYIAGPGWYVAAAIEKYVAVGARTSSCASRAEIRSPSSSRCVPTSSLSEAVQRRRASTSRITAPSKALTTEGVDENLSPIFTPRTCDSRAPHRGGDCERSRRAASYSHLPGAHMGSTHAMPEYWPDRGAVGTTARRPKFGPSEWTAFARTPTAAVAVPPRGGL